MLRKTFASGLSVGSTVISSGSVAPAASKLCAILGDTVFGTHSTAIPSHGFTTSTFASHQPKPSITDATEEATPINVSQSADKSVQPHPAMESVFVREVPAVKDTYWLMQPVYTEDYVRSIKAKHTPPTKFHDYTGYYAVQSLRSVFDLFTGYGGKMTEKKWLARFIYLETVAGVPGMVAAMLRHLRSLRSMSRDNGWIHTLLEEAENERMHLLTFLQLRDPGPVFRFAVLGGQAVFLSLYSVFYAISPKHCHSFVAYLEEEAVKTYTRAIDEIESGSLPDWTNKPAPAIGKKYWRLGDKATMRDLLLAVRADEACHEHVNRVFAHMKPGEVNPFAPGTTMIS